VIDSEARRRVEQLFRNAGISAPLMVAPVSSEDERVFVLAPGSVELLPDLGELTIALQETLGRKVWITDDRTYWTDTEPFR